MSHREKVSEGTRVFAKIQHAKRAWESEREREWEWKFVFWLCLLNLVTLFMDTLLSSLVNTLFPLPILTPSTQCMYHVLCTLYSVCYVVICILPVWISHKFKLAGFDCACTLRWALCSLILLPARVCVMVYFFALLLFVMSKYRLIGCENDWIINASLRHKAVDKIEESITRQHCTIIMANDINKRVRTNKHTNKRGA